MYIAFIAPIIHLLVGVPHVHHFHPIVAKETFSLPLVPFTFCLVVLFSLDIWAVILQPPTPDHSHHPHKEGKEEGKKKKE